MRQPQIMVNAQVAWDSYNKAMDKNKAKFAELCLDNWFDYCEALVDVRPDTPKYDKRRKVVN